MDKPSIDTVKAFYDERIGGKLSDFTESNPRIEAAVHALAEWAPVKPKRILEIGCGIGATSWRMARAWPEAEVIGADVSPASIEVATTCFKLPNLCYLQGLIKEGTLSGKFDFVVLMDVYEHIAIEDRPILHAAINSLLDDDCRVFFAVPTPALQQYAREYVPEGLQPVDEDVGPTEVLQVAADTSTQLLFYREVGIWRYCDYTHFVLGRIKNLSTVSLRKYRPQTGLKSSLKEWLQGNSNDKDDVHDYVGADLLREDARSVHDRFNVSAKQRRSLAGAWLDSEHQASEE